MSYYNFIRASSNMKCSLFAKIYDEFLKRSSQPRHWSCFYATPTSIFIKFSMYLKAIFQALFMNNKINDAEDSKTLKKREEC